MEKHDFLYDAVTCGLDRGRVDLTRAEYFPTRDATTLLTSFRTIVGRDGGLEPKTNVRTTATPKAQPLLFEAHQKINGPHHHRHL